MLNRLFEQAREEMRAHEEHFSLAVKSTAPLLAPANDHSEPPQKPALAAPIVVVLGAKGGVGSTTVAVNLASALSLPPISVTIVDGNFQQPDVAQVLGQDPHHSLMELMLKASEIDDKLFAACRLNIPDSTLGILSPPLNGVSGIHSNLSQLADGLSQIRSYSGLWVVDVPKCLDKHLVTLTDMCDKIVLVFQASVTGVAACRRWIRAFRELGYESDRIICVLNRAGAKYSGVEEQLKDCFADQVIFRLPNSYGSLFESEAHGHAMVLSSPRHAYTKAMLKLANHVRTACANRDITNESSLDSLMEKR